MILSPFSALKQALFKVCAHDLAIALGAQGLFRREEIAETAQALLDAARLQIAQCSDRVVEEKAHFYTRPVVLRRVGDLPALRGLRAEMRRLFASNNGTVTL